MSLIGYIFVGGDSGSINGFDDKPEISVQILFFFLLELHICIGR